MPQDTRRISIASKGKTRYLDVPEPDRPARPATITRIEPPARVEPTHQIQQRSSKPTVSGSHMDKARAFVVVVMPLCFGLGLTSALWCVSMAFFGFFSMWFVVVLFGVFSISTATMYLIDKLISPDGFPILSEYWRHRRLMSEQNRLYDILERDNNG